MSHVFDWASNHSFERLFGHSARAPHSYASVLPSPYAQLAPARRTAPPGTLSSFERRFRRPPVVSFLCRISQSHWYGPYLAPSLDIHAYRSQAVAPARARPLPASHRADVDSPRNTRNRGADGHARRPGVRHSPLSAMQPYGTEDTEFHYPYRGYIDSTPVAGRCQSRHPPVPLPTASASALPGAVVVACVSTHVYGYRVS